MTPKDKKGEMGNRFVYGGMSFVFLRCGMLSQVWASMFWFYHPARPQHGVSPAVYGGGDFGDADVGQWVGLVIKRTAQMNVHPPRNTLNQEIPNIKVPTRSSRK